MLLVDDEPAVRRAMRSVLERFGCQTVDAAGSDEALARLAEFDPDVVIADYRLRVGDSGLEAIRRLRERRPGLPALLISGDTDVGLRRDAADAGLGLLHKPLTMARLGQALESAIMNSAPAGAMGSSGVARRRAEEHPLQARHAR